MLVLKVSLVLATAALCLGADDALKKTPNFARNNRIVNGEDASPGEFPFLASLQYQKKHYCGCTILNSDWVLTAAHCIYGKSLSSFTVRAGTNNWRKNGTLHTVIEGEYHSEFVTYGFSPNDIAVLKVTPPFEWSDLVKPTVLAKAGSDVEDSETPSVISGWGAATAGGLPVDNMQRADALTYSDKICMKQEGPTKKHICAGGIGTGICGGDSGGPLLVDGKQVGVASFTFTPCGDDAAYWTQVSYYRKWISKRTGA